MKDFFKIRNISEENGAGDMGTPSLVAKYKNKDMLDKYKSMREEIDINEGRGNADKHWDIAQGHKEKATLAKGNKEQYHAHMARHHDSMANYHSQLGQNSLAQAHSDKADAHHEKSYQASNESTSEKESMKENVNKSDVPAYLRKQKGEKPLTVADVKGPRKDSISAPANLAKARNEETDLDEANNYPNRYRATYHDPDTGKVAHMMDFNHKSLEAAKKHASVSRLQRKDGKDDVLHSVVQIKEDLDEATNNVNQLRAALARHSEKAIAANKNGDHDAVKVHQNYMNKIKDKMAKAVRTESTVPFDGPYTKTPSNVKDKSGAIHTPMSRARDLARNAIRQQVAKKKDTKESVVPDRMKGKQKPYVSSDGKGNYEVLGNTGQTKATFSRATHGKDAHARAQQHLKNKYDAYVKEDLNELSNKTLASYVDKAVPSVHALDKAGQDKKADKRFDGVVKASDKMTAQAKRTRMSEDASYKVEVEGLPTMYITSASPSEVKQNLRKIIKKADSILSVDRVMDADVRKAFRLKAAGKEEE